MHLQYAVQSCVDTSLRSHTLGVSVPIERIFQPHCWNLVAPSVTNQSVTTVDLTHSRYGINKNNYQKRAKMFLPVVIYERLARLGEKDQYSIDLAILPVAIALKLLPVARRVCWFQPSASCLFMVRPVLERGKVGVINLSLNVSTAFMSW